MASPQQGRRNVRVATKALVALSVAGTIGGAAMAFADTHTSPTAGTTATTGSVMTAPGTGGSDRPGASSSTAGPDSGTGATGSESGVFGTAPRLSTGSGHHHASSSGS
ncbi:hypothetical protein ACFTWF_02800 [Rhodococcus sp. NPDC056960]|uniref:hypothetical protein n=1 Tax=Rhodococcus sp. NPDC056960 TaxID=3345982 RepID=UPI0036311386